MFGKRGNKGAGLSERPKQGFGHAAERMPDPEDLPDGHLHVRL